MPGGVIDINVVTLCGHLCADPKEALKYTQSGKAVCDVTLAVRGYKDKTDFLRLRFWQQSADILVKYCAKGDKITIAGRLCSESYKDKGETKYYTFVTVDQLDFGYKPQGGKDESTN